MCCAFLLQGGKAGKEKRGADTKTKRQLTELFLGKKREREEAY
jgi:hypothetical protein